MVASLGLLPQQRFTLLQCVDGEGREPFVRRAANGMANNGEFVVRHTEYATHELCGTDELFRHDCKCRDPKALCSNGVMQTARRTATSIAQSADRKVEIAH